VEKELSILLSSQEKFSTPSPREIYRNINLNVQIKDTHWALFTTYC
jgi:hypothetical protein